MPKHRRKLVKFPYRGLTPRWCRKLFSNRKSNCYRGNRKNIFFLLDKKPTNLLTTSNFLFSLAITFSHSKTNRTIWLAIGDFCLFSRLLIASHKKWRHFEVKEVVVLSLKEGILFINKDIDRMWIECLFSQIFWQIIKGRTGVVTESLLLHFSKISFSGSNWCLNWV